MTFFSCATFLGEQCWVSLENPSLLIAHLDEDGDGDYIEVNVGFITSHD